MTEPARALLTLSRCAARATAQFIHGLFQSTGGPVNTSIVDKWFPKKGRGLTFGLWTCHQYIGDIASGLTTAALVNNGIHWMYALLLPGVLNFVWGLICLFFLPNKPDEVSGINIPDEHVSSEPNLQSGGISHSCYRSLSHEIRGSSRRAGTG